MDKFDIQLYCGVMDEIKRRTASVRSFIQGESITIYRATTIESMCLQIRKILELIALGSLVANKNEFSKQNEKFKNFGKQIEFLMISKKLTRLFTHAQ
jgi:hypothetical protein